MCNYCNSGTCGNGLWGCGYQRVCRDGCGNIRVYGCGCNHTCGCQNQCGSSCGSTNTTNATSGCGYQNACNGSTASGGDWYYARQYGLYGYSGCPCGSGYTYDTVTQTTT